jgi:hypothetical protein
MSNNGLYRAMFSPHFLEFSIRLRGSVTRARKKSASILTTTYVGLVGRLPRTLSISLYS